MSTEKSHDVNDVIKRLKIAYGFKSDAALADFLGVKPNTIATWKIRKYIDWNLIFAKCDDVSASWLLTGEGSKDNLDLGQGCPRSGEVEGHLEPPGFCAEEGQTPYSDFVCVPQVSGEISAGGGLVPDNTVEMKIAFRREWIQRRGDPQNMSLIRVSGDSMEPTLLSGDLVLIDHGRNFVDPQGGIYAIAMDDTIMIKRLQVIYPAKTLKIISDNSRYEPLEAVTDQVRVNGKVIWFGREIER
ncbi:MAG: helix-turn-helix domain-containing protein [Nitrospirae bacterium]|nr:helix-turn-helix domain-containing protein [Nitrospirota bacterium]